jgi:putative isomerase
MKNQYYEDIKKNLARGWNTWNTYSVLSHVLLPEGFSINLSLKEYKSGKYLRQALIGRDGERDETILPGPHAYDGSYTELTLKWMETELIVQSAVDSQNDIVIMITPVKNQKRPATLVVECGMLWNRPGKVYHTENKIQAEFSQGSQSVFATGNKVYEPNIPTQSPCFTLCLDTAVGISTGSQRSLNEISGIIALNKSKHGIAPLKYGELAELYNAMQCILAWDTIYEPLKGRIITTVSRIWNVNWGGYILFDWDTYFAAYMASIDNKELAYANVIEITREGADCGFIPNFASGIGCKSRDRSEPPVGSLVVRELFRRYRERWLLEELFDALYQWNTWYFNARHVENGLMALGSCPYESQLDNFWEINGVNDRFGAALESGMDNSPIYDNIPFNQQKHVMELADVGLTGLYIMDCEALLDIARILGKKEQETELKNRLDLCSRGILRLWDESTGLFLNKRTDTGEYSPRLSPTSFYALFSNHVTADQVSRMLDGHFYNPDEFYGEWMLPSISRNDPAYPDQDYWRGRIWPPMNLLVYLALRRHHQAKACSELAEKSMRMLLNGWLDHGCIYENYSGDTGEGSYRAKENISGGSMDGGGKVYGNSDRFYSWGALLSLITFIEAGIVEGPEVPL